jgi:hypothetical protein
MLIKNTISMALPVKYRKYTRTHRKMVFYLLLLLREPRNNYIKTTTTSNNWMNQLYFINFGGQEGASFGALEIFLIKT